MMKKIILPAPAKVNLFLRILGKRKDGYHEISSLMQPVSLYDQVTVTVSEGAGVAVGSSNPSVPKDNENIAFKAATFFLNESGLDKRVDIWLDKRIPMGAGLVGGSSDAAAVLKGLNTLSGEPFDPFDNVQLKALGALIGSDVPFFIQCRPAIASGRGEKLSEVSLPSYHYILVNPGFEVSTAWAYGNFDLTKSDKDNNLLYSHPPHPTPPPIPPWRKGGMGGVGWGGWDGGGGVDAIKGRLVNDLEAVTSARYPAIGEIKKTLKDSGAVAAIMSGSGPTVFGIYGSCLERDRAFQLLEPRLNDPFTLFRVDGL
ncbi:MAG: 4-(cytidine 5'-diphospho)-2-C-methyl-D-erythritol kinase [Deltaproteobacteria bacterium]|nr:4-(cytidine 5'-diphospho)-2-C-methyl-D-erythritol kinase [Deltaproteobacteria bacterium]